MKCRETTGFSVAIKIGVFLCAVFVFAGCRNIFLEELFAPKGEPLENIILINSRGQQIQSSFDPEVLFNEYTVDSNVRLKLVLARGATARWGFINLDNTYTDEIAIPLTAGTSKQVLISAIGKREVSKTYSVTLIRADACYLRAGAPDGGDGSYDRPFNTVSAAVVSAVQTGKKIFVEGEVEAAGALSDTNNSFVFNDIGTIHFVGISGTNAALKGSTGKRVLSVAGTSTVVFENIALKGNGSVDAGNSGIRTETGATVTLGTGATVREFGTGIEKGVSVNGGTFVIDGVGNPGRVLTAAGNAAGEVYLPTGNTVKFEKTIYGLTTTILAKIVAQEEPTLINGGIQVFSGKYIPNNCPYFEAASDDFKLSNVGKLVLANIPSGNWYVDATNGNDDNLGLSAAKPFLTLGKALAEVAKFATDANYTAVQTITLSGTVTASHAGAINGTSITTNESVFTINNTAAAELRIVGSGTGAILSSEGAGTKRAVDIPNNSKPVRFENITIKSAGTTTQNGGGIKIGTNVEVTLGDKAKVEGNGSAGMGRGVYVDGRLTLDGIEMGRVSVGDVYLANGKKVRVEPNLPVQSSNPPLARISVATAPTIASEVQVLDAYVSEFAKISPYFASADSAYKVTNRGGLVVASMPDGNWYVSVASGDDAGNDGITAEFPFKTLGKAVSAVKHYASATGYAGAQTITISGTLDYASESATAGETDSESVFYIANVDAKQLSLIGTNNAKLTNGSTDGNKVRRILKLVNSTVVIKNIAIENSATATKDGGGIHIAANAAVTLGTGTDVKGNGTSGNGKGVYVGGKLIFSDSGKVSVGDVYFASTTPMYIADSLAAANTKVAAITLPVASYPASGTDVQVLDGLFSILSVQYTKFSASNTAYTVTNHGKLVPKDFFYVKSTGSDLKDGLTPSTAVKTLSKAIEKASASSDMKTIYVDGTLTQTSEGGSAVDSVFVINNTGAAEILIKGKNTAILNSTGGTAKRVVTVTGSSKIRFEDITIQNSGTTTQSGGGMYVDSSATVTLGSGTDVKGNADSTGTGKGVYASGQLVFAGSGTVSSGDVYLPKNKTIKITSTLTTTSVIKITPQAYPDAESSLTVLSAAPTNLLSANYTKFASSDDEYRITDEGKMEFITTYYVKADGSDDNNGLSEANAFLTLTKAIEEASASHTRKTISVVGILGQSNATGTGTNTNSVFVIKNTSNAEILITGTDATAGLSAANANKRVVEIASGSGAIKFELIKISGANTVGKDGGGLYISSGTVTLGNGAVVTQNEVKGNEGSGRTVSGSDGKGGGAYLAGGTLVISGTGSITGNTVRGGTGSGSSMAVDKSTGQVTTYPAGNGGNSYGGGVYKSSSATISGGGGVSGNGALGGSSGPSTYGSGLSGTGYNNDIYNQ